MAGWTRGELLRHLRDAGVEPGRDVLVHTSMRAVGWIDGGPAALLWALRHAVGQRSRVVVPAQTTEYSTTSNAYRERLAAVSPQDRAGFLRRLSPFVPSETPSSGMGILAEYVRAHKQSVRSSHPTASFAAIGIDAAQLTRVHLRSCHLGADSPLGALYREQAQVLLLGVGFDKTTAFHLAEYRVQPRERTFYSKVPAPGLGRSGGWMPYRGVILDASDFAAIGADMAAQAWVRPGRVGNAPTWVFPLDRAVDFAEEWMLKHREGVVPVRGERE